MGLKPGRMKGPGGGGTPGGNEGGGMFMGPENPGGGTPTAPIGWTGGTLEKGKMNKKGPNPNL